MRTTVEILGGLFAKVKRTMQKRRTTLRALVEEGLAQVVAGKPAQPPRPRRAVFPGQPGLASPHQPDDLPRLLQALRHSGYESQLDSRALDLLEALSAERDYTRFPALRTRNPLVESQRRAFSDRAAAA